MRLRVMAYKTRTAYDRLAPWAVLIVLPALFGWGLAEWVTQ